MKILIQADDITDRGEDLSEQKMVDVSLEHIGSEAYVRVEIGGRRYDIGFRDFWAASRAVCEDFGS